MTPIYLLLASLAWVALLVWSATTAPPPPGSGSAWLMAMVDAAASIVCHGRDDRSFAGPARALAVCARCTGLYVGAVVGAWLAWRRCPRRWQDATEDVLAGAARRILLLAGLPTVVTLVGEASGVGDPGNAGRALAALPLGAAVAWLAATVGARSRATRLPEAAAHDAGAPQGGGCRRPMP